jgi:hypothetical protein
MKTSSSKSRLSSASSVIALGALLIGAFTTLSAGSLAQGATPIAKPSLGAARPTIGGGNSQEGSAEGVARSAAFAKYQDCLSKTGVALPSFGGRGFGGGADDQNRVRPTGAPANPANPPSPRKARPTLSAAQQAALDKCAPLRPSFGRGFDGAKRPAGITPSAGTIIKKVAPSTAPSKAASKVAPKPAAGAAYISCLNANGVNVTTAAQIATLDKKSPKIAAALSKCAPKK